MDFAYAKRSQLGKIYSKPNEHLQVYSEASFVLHFIRLVYP